MPFYITYEVGEVGRQRHREVLQTPYGTREEALQAAREAVRPTEGDDPWQGLCAVVRENVQIVEANTWLEATVDLAAQASPELAAVFDQFPDVRQGRLNDSNVVEDSIQLFVSPVDQGGAADGTTPSTE